MSKTNHKFDKIKADFISAKDKTNQAKKDIQDAEKALKKHQEKLPKLRESMIEAKANAEAGEGSTDLADKAQKDLSNALQQLENLKLDLEVKKRVLPKRMEQERKPHDELRKEAEGYYSEKAKPVLARIEKAVLEIKEATEESQKMFAEASSFKIPAHQYIPEPLDDVLFSKAGSVQNEGIEAYLTKIQKLQNENRN